MPGLASDPLGLRFADQEELIAQLLETRLLIGAERRGAGGRPQAG